MQKERANVLFAPSTAPMLRAVVQDTLLSAHSGSILDKGAVPMFTAANVTDLRRLYDFMTTVGRQDDLRRLFYAYIKVRVHGHRAARQCVHARAYGDDAPRTVHAPLSPRLHAHALACVRAWTWCRARHWRSWRKSRKIRTRA
ncbi:hypothetical protein EON64_05120 [archaeon]|nr:MAG: hypothetical protein EON64_05120 [archaeon]